MPQMSPLSWILVVFTLYFVFTKFLSSMEKMHLESTKKSEVHSKKKVLKW